MHWASLGPRECVTIVALSEVIGLGPDLPLAWLDTGFELRLH